ncbi:MAG: hypothetical protein ABFD69_10510 [Candidatus Sumerlaeia bacterium]
MKQPLKIALVAIALAAAGCALSRGVHIAQARATEAGVVSATLSQGGISQILADAGRGQPAWDGVLLENRGSSRIGDIRLWGAGPVDLIAPTAGSFSPFTLKPGERFLCRETQGGLEGSFLWTMPVDAAAAAAGIQRIRHGRLEPGRGVVLQPKGGEAWVQLVVDAPFDHTGARIGWESQPSRALTAYVSLDGRAWGQAVGSTGEAWLKPLDVSATVKGKRRFWVRLTTPAGKSEVVVGKLRIERDAAAIGHIRPFRPGINESAIAFDAPRGALMEFKLLGE